MGPKDGKSWLPKNHKLESLSKEKKMRQRAFHTTARVSDDRNNNWLNSSMTIESSEERKKGGKKARFMNDIINKSIDIPMFN
jgi:hypothetical protein